MNRLKTPKNEPYVQRRSAAMGINLNIILDDTDEKIGSLGLMIPQTLKPYAFNILSKHNDSCAKIKYKMWIVFIHLNHIVIHPIVVFILMVTIFIFRRNYHWIYHCMFEIFCHLIFRELKNNQLPFSRIRKFRHFIN